MRHLSLTGRLTTNYANDLVLGRQGNQVVMRPIAHRLTTELGVAIGLLGWLEVGLAMPFYLQQGSEGYQTGSPGQVKQGTLNSTLVGDMRLVVKARILDNRRFSGFGLAGVLELSLPTGSRDQLAGDASVTFTPRVVVDYRTKNGFVIALNLAYRLRGEETFYSLTIDDEIRVSLGTEVPLFFGGLALIGEALFVAGIPQFSQGGGVTGQRNLSTELRTGLRWRHDSGAIVTLGAGFGVTGGFGAPDLRLFLDVSFGRNVADGKADASLEEGYLTAVAKGKRVVIVQKDPSTGSPPNKRVVSRQPPPVRGVTAPPPVKVAKLDPKAFDKGVASDPDRDGDGIPDSLDKCPNEPEDFDSFQDTDGCPDPDNDKDGIPDALDKCPLKKETINGVEDDDGCPDKGKSKVVLVKGSIKILDKVYFNSGKDTLQKRSFPILRQVSSFLKANWQIRKVLIEGHTDSRGDKEMNVDLSERRARRVMAFLISQGVSRRILKAKGYGPKIPIASNRTGAGRAKNRRVAFKVLQVFVPKQTTSGKGGQP
jgi:outer membrane protein OmpA-like peptidoglycan-associated protein